MATTPLVLALSCALAPAQETRGRAATDVVVESLAPDALVLRWANRGAPGDAAAADLRVWLGEVEPDATCSVADRPPMLGGVEVGVERLVFRPRLPLRAGQVYTLCFGLQGRDTDAELSARWSDQIVLGYATGTAGEEPPRVVSVWPPPGEPIPANTLRFYLEFDQPMRAAAVHRAVGLVDAHGEPIEDALVPLPEGLWDSGRRRLTVRVHPGRIKRGVGPREVLGPVLQAGTPMRLRVGPPLRSAAGQALVPANFAYSVVPEDRVAPDPAAWRLLPPTSRHEPVRLELDERLDPAVLRRAVRLVRSGDRADRIASGEPVGDIDVEIAEAGRSVGVLPTIGEWRPGSYRLEVNGIVEDLAGNRPGRPFDSELREDGPVGGRQREPRWFTFVFEIPDPVGRAASAPPR